MLFFEWSTIRLPDVFALGVWLWSFPARCECIQLRFDNIGLPEVVWDACVHSVNKVILIGIKVTANMLAVWLFTVNTAYECCVCSLLTFYVEMNLAKVSVYKYFHKTDIDLKYKKIMKYTNIRGNA